MRSFLKQLLELGQRPGPDSAPRKCPLIELPAPCGRGPPECSLCTTTAPSNLRLHALVRSPGPAMLYPRASGDIQDWQCGRPRPRGSEAHRRHGWSSRSHFIESELLCGTSKLIPSQKPAGQPEPGAQRCTWVTSGGAASKHRCSSGEVNRTHILPRESAADTDRLFLLTG